MISDNLNFSFTIISHSINEDLIYSIIKINTSGLTLEYCKGISIIGLFILDVYAVLKRSDINMSHSNSFPGGLNVIVPLYSNIKLFKYFLTFGKYRPQILQLITKSSPYKYSCGHT